MTKLCPWAGFFLIFRLFWGQWSLLTFTAFILFLKVSQMNWCRFVILKTTVWFPLVRFPVVRFLTQALVEFLRKSYLARIPCNKKWALPVNFALPLKNLLCYERVSTQIVESSCIRSTSNELMMSKCLKRYWCFFKQLWFLFKCATQVVTIWFSLWCSQSSLTIQRTG